MKLKHFEIVARYLLGLVYLFGAVDGVLFLFFGMHVAGRPNDGSFLAVLQQATWFWAFMKLVELAGALSLLANYKPALGVALLTPVSAVLCLFYVFDVQWYYAFTLVGVLNLVLLRAYWTSYRPMLDAYPVRGTRPDARPASATLAQAIAE